MSVLSPERGLVLARAVEPGARDVVLAAAESGIPVVFSVPADSDGRAVTEEAERRGAAGVVSYLVADVSREEGVEALFDLASERMDGLGAAVAFARTARPLPLLETSL